MNERQTLSILFYLRRDKKKSEKEVPIYMRVTVNGRRAEMAIHRFIDPDHWNNESGIPRGSKNEYKQLSEYLVLMRSKVYQAQKKLLEDGKNVTSLAIRNQIQGKEEKHRTLLEVFEYHNKLMKENVPGEYSPSTLKRFETTKKHIKDFIRKQYNSDDLLLSQLSYEFVSSLEHYFRTVRGCNHNSTVKYIKNLKKIINLARKNDWLNKDPFVNYSTKTKPVKREFLTADELRRLEEKNIPLPRLAQVRDIFVFSCYTGLAYVDVFNLSKENIVKGIDGQDWIFTRREKTEGKSNIPLLPKALEIIERYKDNPDCLYNNRLLPVLSNQKMNAYLKEIAILAAVNKNLSSHIGRHTFATTVTLTNGVPIESVSEMLGHKSIRTTQIYAKVIDKKVSEDMSKLKSKLTHKINKRKSG